MILGSSPSCPIFLRCKSCTTIKNEGQKLMSNDVNRPFPLRRFKDRCGSAAFIALIYCFLLYDEEIRASFFQIRSYFIYHILPTLIGISLTILITQKSILPSEKWAKVMNFVQSIFVCFCLNHITAGTAVILFLKLTPKFFPASELTISKPIILYLATFMIFFLSSMGYLQIIWMRHEKIFKLSILSSNH